MPGPDLLQFVESEGVNGFLRYVEQSSQEWLSVKVGGTAMMDIMGRNKVEEDSDVLRGIKDLVGNFNKNLVLVVSAAGKVFGSEHKITQRLIASLRASREGNEALGKEIIDSLEQDHMAMVRNGVKDENQVAVNESVQAHFKAIREYLHKLADYVPGYILDKITGIGEELGSIILAAMMNAAHLSTQDHQVDSAGEFIGKSLAEIIDEFSKKIQAAIRNSNNENINIVPGFPGFINPTGTITETGMGYSDFTTVMATPENGFVILLKQSGAVLQTNPKILPKGYDVNKIKIMPIRQAVRMTELIGDQIQVIHPMALEEAQRKGLTLMVIDEKCPLGGGGTLILPNSVYDDYQTGSSVLEASPMMGVAEDAYELTITFSTPTSGIRESQAITELEQKLANSGVKVVDKGQITSDDGGRRQISLIVSGLTDTSIPTKRITDITAIEIGNPSYIVGISGVGSCDLNQMKSEMSDVFGGRVRYFQGRSSDKLFSLGILVTKTTTNSDREGHLKEVMEILNTPQTSQP